MAQLFQGICVGGPNDGVWMSGSQPVVMVPSSPPVPLTRQVEFNLNDKIMCHEYVYETWEFRNDYHPTWSGKVEIWRHAATYRDRYELLVGIVDRAMKVKHPS